MDTLRATIDNMVNAGFVVRAGNMHGGLVVQFEEVYQCYACQAIVPAAFHNANCCVNCQPAMFEVASTGTDAEA